MVKQKTGNMKNRKEKLKNTPKLKEASYTVCLDKDFLIDGRRSLIWDVRLGGQKEQFQYITVHNFGAP